MDNFVICHEQIHCFKVTIAEILGRRTLGQGGKRVRRGRAARDTEEGQAPATAFSSSGYAGGRYAPLSDDEAQNTHETAIELLETLGLSQATPKMTELVVARGGRVTEQGRLLFPSALIRDVLDGVRRDVVLFGRGAGLDLDLSGDKLHFSSGGASPSLVDLETGRYRDATTGDLYDAARIVDAMENIHHFSRSLVARDAPDPLSMDINTAYACLAGTRKHVSVSATKPEHVAALADICHLLAGGEAAFRARPFMTIMVCHVVPPMRFAAEACDTLDAALRAGFPVQIISAGQAGATSPASVAGSLVQAVAETLAGVAFAWLVAPDARIIFAPKPLVADLRTGAMCGGGGEQAVLMAGAAQMGRFYNLPTSSIAGITDAKTADAQSGYEKSLAVTLAAQAGSNLITQACGMQASLLGASLEAYVIDNDMLGAIMRSVRGIEATEANLSAQVISDVCLGEGHYLGHLDTLARMKADYSYPLIADRQSPREWEEAGAQDIRNAARDHARRILADHHPKPFSREIDDILRSQHDIVIGRQRVGRT